MSQKTAVITGCNRGIGLAFSRKYLRNGYKVIGGCRNPNGARDLWELQSDFGDDLTVLELDVSSDESTKKFADQIKPSTNVDVVINNAGLLLGGNQSIEGLSIEDMQKMYEVNTLGPMRVTNALWQHISSEKYLTKLIHITSRMGSIADNTSGGYYGYRMTKTALNMFNKSLSFESGSFITTVIHPGWVKTAMGGESALLDVFESTDGIYQVIENLKKEDCGTFLNYNGETISW